MKKIILVLVTGFLIVISAIFSYNFLVTEKLSREFLDEIKMGNVPVGHPQEDLIMELIDVGLHNNIEKNSQFNVNEHKFNFSLKVSKDDTNRFVLLEDVEIVTGYFIQKEYTPAGFIYIIENNGSEIAVTSPFDFGSLEKDIIRFILVDGEAVAISLLEEVNLSKILYHDAESVTGEVEGTFDFAKNPMIFGMEERLHIGQTNVDIYLKEGLVIGIVAREEFVPDTIRVLVNDTGFNNLHHNKIELYSKGLITLTCKITEETLKVDNETIIEFVSRGNMVQVTIDGKNHEYQGRVYVESDKNIYLNNIKRGGNNSLTIGYRGDFEIFVQDDRLYVVNELPLDEYLYGVVPSEMPLSFGLEALKVQSIAARTYAINNIYRSPYRRYSAHVVDSVMNQVYNNTYEYELTNKAVDATKGKVIKHNGKIIDAKFFSTSSGYTANSHEVWEHNGNFPAEEVPYLIAKAQGLSKKHSIGTEEAFGKFITDLSIVSYDNQSPFYRWTIEMTEKQLRKSIEGNLAARYKADPNRILTYDGNEFISKDITENPLGRIKELKVFRRGQGGNITHLDIIGENGAYRIEKEFNIRFTLRPVCNISPVEIKRIDGSSLVNYSILPSAFVFFEQTIKDGKMERIVFYGGGNGHGVGMSQYGVVGMIKAGYNPEEIISHYYEGAQIKVLY